jgi:cyd operon protein YbgT
MWYFSWVLGLGLAVTFGILNGIWHEFGLPSTDPDLDQSHPKAL